MYRNIEIPIFHIFISATIAIDIDTYGIHGDAT